ncbi:hypothetical protein BDV96DRAFT_654810 [Lophiotrema nucula]|uniref:Uncharacterized protein n=1 Tax=Lophiotrema nucula TaxID=690887 RepID=A0A6A5YJD1_9PLEO|nr:hypothetical protein BDV96DRAFT_654810 [Lophiotrema nucula]
MKWYRKAQGSSASRETSKRRKSESRTKFMTHVCGYDANVHIKTDLEGLHVYTDHVERSMLNLLGSQASNDALEQMFGLSDSPNARVDQLLDLCVALSEILEDLTPQTSFDQLSTSILDRYKVASGITKKHKDIMLQIVSACVGWISMLYITPSITPQTAPGLVRVMTGQDAPGKLRGAGDAPHRPIGALLRNSGLIPIACGPPPGLGIADAHLMTTKLNFASLHGLGGISVQWVDQVAQHCSFSKEKKIIRLFGIPSVYLALCKQQNVNIAFQRQTGAEIVPVDFRRTLPLPRDPVLDALCGKYGQEYSEEQDDSFPEREVYDGSNFPQLGQRLFELQDYITSQKPRTLKDVWNDRRDPHQAFTFWAVVIVGGATIALGLLQVVLSALQLVYTIRPEN